ncbi:hypothetical protein JW905_10150, partial [bacterium]|nr:hypothetical protein [candidate division CSSED10-310 bacterium]
MKFDSWTEVARFHNPMKGGRLDEQVIERRRDPLTGTTSILSRSLTDKAALFFGKTDEALIGRLERNSREGCLFCPERVYDVTPRYPADVLPEGRMERDGVLLFPNIFPLSGLHAVLVRPTVHSLRLHQFTSEVLRGFLATAAEFIGTVRRQVPAWRFASVNCNHLPPAGASLMHPHFQVFGGERPPGRLQWEFSRVEKYRRATGAWYWEALVEEERRLGRRYIVEDAG